MKRAIYLLTSILLLAGCAEEAPIEEDLSDAYEELMNDDGSADSARCSGVVVPDRGPFFNRIALTFDDGPNLANTPRVLEVLEAHGATATFFVNGRVIGTEGGELLQQMAEAGHLIGNHTQNHKDSRTLSADGFRRELQQTDEAIRALGIEPRFMRFPYGSANCTTAGIARDEFGYRVVGWHIDTADWCFSSSTGGVGYCSPSTFAHVPDRYRGDFVGWIVSQAQSRGGGVMLMHDIQSYTASQLDSVLTALEEAGFEFVGLDDATVFPQLNGEEPSRSWIGTSCTEHETCNFYDGDRQGSCTSVDPEVPGFCTVPCEGYCPDRYGFATTFCVESSSPGVGLCVAQSAEENDYCADIPGTAPTTASRFVGSSGASEREATVCLPVVE